MATTCKICFSTTELSYLEIFGENDTSKGIARMISKHLWFEVLPTDEVQWICEICWKALREFQEFYDAIEKLHYSRAENPLKDGDIKVEFLAIKPEPIEYDDDDENDDAFDEPLPEAYVKIETEPLAAASRASQGRAGSRRKPKEAKQKKVKLKDDSKGAKNEQLNDAMDAELLEFYRRLICEICDSEQMARGEATIEYGTLRELNKHMKVMHKQDNVYIKCPICEKKMQFRVKLLQHKDMHLHPDKYRCAVCQEVHQNMNEHMQVKHKERSFCCDLCESKFPTKGRLAAHMRKIHAEKNVICEFCQKAFTKYAIEDHKRAVHTTRFVCEHCPKTFKIRSRLYQHMEEHDESLRNSTAVTCTVCGQVLRHKYILTQHMKLMHTEQTPVDCASCGKTFKSKRSLAAHMASVCTDRSFPCTVCGKRFKRKIKLKEHMTTHTGKALYMCSFCPATFNQDTHLYYHRKQVHYEQWLVMQQKRKAGVRFRLHQVDSLADLL